MAFSKLEGNLVKGDQETEPSAPGNAIRVGGALVVAKRRGEVTTRARSVRSEVDIIADDGKGVAITGNWSEHGQ